MTIDMIGALAAFTDKVGPEELAKACEAMNVANRPGRYQL
jgi:hypothetical protein